MIIVICDITSKTHKRHFKIHSLNYSRVFSISNHFKNNFENVSIKIKQVGV